VKYLTTRVAIKVIAAIFCALLFMVGFWLLVSQIDIFGGGQINPLPALVAGAGACLLLGWVNSRSITRALIGALVAIIIGIPIAFWLLVPIADAIAHEIAPYGSLSASGSFSGIWFLLMVIILIEIITDNGLQPGRWQKMVIGTLIAIVLLIGVEIFTIRFGRTSALSDVKLAIYAPTLWAIIVLATNLQDLVSPKYKEDQRDRMNRKLRSYRQ
jgi:hypothetical protein